MKHELPKNMVMLQSFKVHIGFALALFLLIGNVSQLEAVDNKRPQTNELDLAKFGQLPVRFNWRVTTYEVVAKNYLRRAYLIELRSQDSPKPAPAKPAKEITHKAPKNWKPLKQGPISKASFEITEGEGKAKLTIVALKAGPAKLLGANINRWRGQIKLPAQPEDKAVKETKPITVDNHKGTFVELYNPENQQRILVAIVKHGEQDWYFKMMGEETAVEGERKNFQAFLKSVKFPPPAEDSSGNN